jgi:hypothetical protein
MERLVGVYWLDSSFVSGEAVGQSQLRFTLPSTLTISSMGFELIKPINLRGGIHSTIATPALWGDCVLNHDGDCCGVLLGTHAITPGAISPKMPAHAAAKLALPYGTRF